MKSTWTEVDVALIDGVRWKLTSDLRVQTRDGKEWVVPKGFITDFASSNVGRFNLLSIRSAYSVAAVFHDYLYLTGVVSRKLADNYFYELLEDSGSGRYNRFKGYFGVRLFGWLAWRKHRQQQT